MLSPTCHKKVLNGSVPKNGASGFRPGSFSLIRKVNNEVSVVTANNEEIHEHTSVVRLILLKYALCCAINWRTDDS